MCIRKMHEVKLVRPINICMWLFKILFRLRGLLVGVIWFTIENTSPRGRCSTNKVSVRLLYKLITTCTF